MASPLLLIWHGQKRISSMGNGRPPYQNIQVPLHSFAPLKKSWPEIYTPVYGHMKVGICMILKGCIIAPNYQDAARYRDEAKSSFCSGKATDIPRHPGSSADTAVYRRMERDSGRMLRHNSYAVERGEEHLLLVVDMKCSRLSCEN